MASAGRLALRMNGRRVGTWTHTPSSDELAYDADWAASAEGRPLSLSLPFTPGNAPHADTRNARPVRSWFENLLPDNPAIRERLARRFRARSTGAFDLLAEIGRDCVGALQIGHEHTEPRDVRRLDAEPLDEARIARLLRNTAGARAEDDAAGEDDLRISIAGAQEKTALLWHDGRWWLPRGTTPTTHILKLPLGRVGTPGLDLSDSVENEWLCARLLEALGLPVARCHPLVFEGQRVLAVERFDRRWADDARRGPWLLRLPQEDLCQATGTPPERKYESDGGPGIDRILSLLDGSATRVQDRWSFLRTQLVFWLLRAPDGHAKNFSLALRAGGAFALTPLYDVMSAWPLLGGGPNHIAPQRVKLAMAVRSKNPHWTMQDVLRRHWLEVARRHGVLDAAGRHFGAAIDELVQRAPAAVETVQAGLPKGFPARVADPILGGVLRAARQLG